MRPDVTLSWRFCCLIKDLSLRVLVSANGPSLTLLPGGRKSCSLFNSFSNLVNFGLGGPRGLLGNAGPGGGPGRGGATGGCCCRWVFKPTNILGFPTSSGVDSKRIIICRVDSLVSPLAASIMADTVCNINLARALVMCGVLSPFDDVLA